LFKVTVKDNKIEHALRLLKKKVKDSGLLIELREREFYTKPSLKKREQRKRARAMYKNLSKNK
jgi:small subunit ribosomal protein S21